MTTMLRVGSLVLCCVTSGAQLLLKRAIYLRQINSLDIEVLLASENLQTPSNLSKFCHIIMDRFRQTKTNRKQRKETKPKQRRSHPQPRPKRARAKCPHTQQRRIQVFSIGGRAIAKFSRVLHSKIEIWHKIVGRDPPKSAPGVGQCRIRTLKVPKENKNKKVKNSMKS